MAPSDYSLSHGFHGASRVGMECLRMRIICLYDGSSILIHRKKSRGLSFRFCNILGEVVAKYAKNIVKSAKCEVRALEGIVCMEDCLLYLQCNREILPMHKQGKPEPCKRLNDLWHHPSPRGASRNGEMVELIT